MSNVTSFGIMFEIIIAQNTETFKDPLSYLRLCQTNMFPNAFLI